MTAPSDSAMKAARDLFDKFRELPFDVHAIDTTARALDAFAEAATKDLNWQIGEIMKERDGDIAFAVDAARRDERDSIRGWIELMCGGSTLAAFDADEARYQAKRGAAK